MNSNPSMLAYERFISALRDRTIVPGASITQSELVSRLGMPLGAVREALVMLQSEGLVTVKPRSGIAVRQADLRMVRDSYKMRLLVEEPAIREYAVATAASKLEALRDHHVATIDTLSAKGPSPAEARRLVAEDMGWHTEIVKTLDNPLATRAHRSALEHIALVRADRGSALKPAMIAASLHEHISIIDACLARDPDRAASLLQEHFRGAIGRALNL